MSHRDARYRSEEISPGVGWGRGCCQIIWNFLKISWTQAWVGVGVRLRLGLGSILTNSKFFEELLNTGVGWGWCKIKVGVGNSYPTRLFWNFQKRSWTQVYIGVGLIFSFRFSTHSQHHIEVGVNVNWFGIFRIGVEHRCRLGLGSE